MRRLTGTTIDLLRALIQNGCVNDGTADSGHETRNVDTIEAFFAGSGIDVQRFTARPGRDSLVARIDGSDPSAPSLCLMGHTDVVPVNEAGWDRDPFAAEVVRNADGVDEVWGRGAVDMLNITSSQAVAFRHLATNGFRPNGDLIFFAVADEESGSQWGARWMAENHPDAIRADYVLTENGGLHSGSDGARTISVNVGEKGVAWRRLRIRGVPGHGSMPFRKDNALVTAAAVVNRLAEYAPPARFDELWRQQVARMEVSDADRALLLDERRIDEYLTGLPNVGNAAFLHACTHTTFSSNVMRGSDEMKTNVIPDDVVLEVDVRTVPGDGADEVDQHLRTSLGDLYDRVEVDVLMNDPASRSPIDTPLWDALTAAVGDPFPDAEVVPSTIVGFTDARIYREMGAVAYGAALMSPSLDPGEFSLRFHGHNERIDVDSLAHTTKLWVDVARRMLG